MEKFLQDILSERQYMKKLFVMNEVYRQSLEEDERYHIPDYINSLDAIGRVTYLSVSAKMFENSI
jgi:hypothetical protein